MRSNGMTVFGKGRRIDITQQLLRFFELLGLGHEQRCFPSSQPESKCPERQIVTAAGSDVIAEPRDCSGRSADNLDERLADVSSSVEGKQKPIATRASSRVPAASVNSSGYGTEHLPQTPWKAENSIRPVSTCADEVQPCIAPNQHTDDASDAPEAPPPELELAQPVPNTAPASSSFLLEVLVTAGPRKPTEPGKPPTHIELGEDSGGVACGDGFASFWVADGASEMPFLASLPGTRALSSRLLAQTLGKCFVDAAVSLSCRPSDISLSSLNVYLFRRLREEWQRRVEHYTEALERHGHLRRFLDVIEPQGSRLVWQSTFLGGLLIGTPVTRLLYGVNHGDSWGIIASGTASKLLKPKKSPSIGVSVEWSADGGEASAVCSVLAGAGDWCVLEDVQGLVALSDGVLEEENLREAISTVEDALARDDFPGIREWILQRRDQTDDDKTVVLGRVVHSVDS
jgi:hypothetical protein